MKARLLMRRRVIVAADAFVEVVIRRVPEPIPPSSHRFKYRLAHVVGGERVVRYDNESGKGDHRHMGGREASYAFADPAKLLADFEAAIGRWNLEHRRP